jgi:HSP20 family protein
MDNLDYFRPEKKGGNYYFPIDVEETDTQYCIYADLPGINKSEVSISFEDNTLNIACTRPVKTGKYPIQERFNGKAQRSIRFIDADQDSCKATMKDGVLIVTIDKQSTSKTKTITVQ